MRQKLKLLLVVLCLTLVQTAFAQEKAITGTVTDNSGIPLLGVNIIVKGTSNGTQTDFDGNYSITASVGETLAYSYIGYSSQEAVVGASNVMDITLEEGEALNEVVITALGVSREKKSLGYATQQVDSEELNVTRPQNAISSLSGKVAGVQVTNNSSNLGGSTRILIRGASSVTQDNRPLIVVDGIPIRNDNVNSTTTQVGSGGRDYGDSSFDINPDDIESVNVLKGGSAAALYGNRGINGVILITTKKGKKGKGQVTVNSGVSFETINILPSVQKKYGGGGGDPGTIGQVDFATANIGGTDYNIVDYGTDESWGPRYAGQQVLHWDAFDPEFPEDFLTPREWKYPENDASTFFNTGIALNNGIAFTQGTEDSQMRLSVNNTQIQGIVPNSELDKNTVNFQGSSQITDRIKIDAGVNFTITDGFNRPETGYGSNSVILQFYQFGQTSLDYDRLKNFVLPDGTQRTWNRDAFDDPRARYTDNPYWIVNRNIATDKRTRWFGNVGLKYDISDKLYATGKIYADTYNLRINNNIVISEISTQQSQHTENARQVQEINYEARLHYDDTFLDDKFSLNAFVGTNRRNDETHILAATTQGGLVVPGIYNLGNSVNDATVTEFDSKKRVNSVFGSASFGFNNFVYLGVTARNDWSSALPEENNSFFYPSANLSFVFSSLIDADWLSFGKLRGGYAEVGNDLGPYNLINSFGANTSFNGVIRFSNPNTNKNQFLQPENKRTYEIGLEMSFFKRRFSFDVTYYDELTEDLITPVDVDPSSGFNATFANAGSLSNKGIEALVNITPIQTEDFNWDITWNFAKNENELLSLLPGVSSLNIANYTFNGVSLNAVVGEPYGVIRGTNFVFDDNGNRVVDAATGTYLSTVEQEDLGTVTPDYNMGIRNTFSYKGINLGVLVDIQKGGAYRSLTNFWGHSSGILEATAAGNIREEGIVLDGVTADVTFNDDGTYTVENTQANTQVVSAQSHFQTYGFGGIDAFNVFDASYVKLREVTLGYTLPAKWFNDQLDSVRINAFGRNLAVWGLDNDDFDPEVASSGSGNIQGAEGGSLPSTRTIGFNVELKF
ncbi:SusC/RagA family TonB-linked outer membrane protein [Cochleicola gelatinilyticus]|uniref:SusC/RagA family TonB-linked outer membrane protein n=1 Tax=Cochleicola gelatinilyticus TaxID=1763537 RepID=A0A167F1L2_9FLAO|nr:SusC/RagA family TonB-linked outer membrane protein [Cochleicola gelatinilyticus]OAB76094.1 SusC/RagA family TonB-linked outer membrane protein [Cochleicola gelatinilyticus]